MYMDKNLHFNSIIVLKSPDMTIAVDWDAKHKLKRTNKIIIDVKHRQMS